MKTYQAYPTLLLALSCVCFSALADKTEFDFEAAAGLEYDSNVNVQELDRTAGAADTARLLNARMSGVYKPTEKLSLKAGYSYASKDYREYDEFDQALHTLSGDAHYDFSFATVGGMYHVAEARLASDPFLTLKQRSIYAGKLFNDHIYLRAGLNNKDKTFDNNPGRDADGSGFDVDLFVFFNGADSFLSIGLLREDENARSAIFDNDALGFRGRLSNKFVFLGKNNEMQLAWRYLNRDYSQFDPLIGDHRSDVRRSSEASWKIALMPFLSVVGKLEYGRHNSNLESADYNETLSSITMVAKF